MSDADEASEAAALPPPTAVQWRPSAHFEEPVMTTLMIEQRMQYPDQPDLAAWAAQGRWAHEVQRYGASRPTPLPARASEELLSKACRIDIAAAHWFGSRAEERSAEWRAQCVGRQLERAEPSRRKRKRGGKKHNPNEIGSTGGRSMPWNVGHVKTKPVGTAMAVIPRAIEDPVGELARHTVQPMNHLPPGVVMMCCAPTCRAETEYNRCVRCKGADLTDHMVCTGCGATDGPRATALDTAHHCGGSWTACDGVSHPCQLCSGGQPTGPLASRIIGWATNTEWLK